MKTSLYVRSWPGSGCSRRIVARPSGAVWAEARRSGPPNATGAPPRPSVCCIGTVYSCAGWPLREALACTKHSDGWVPGGVVGCPNLRAVAAADDPPVVLVHGWGGSFETTWRQSGFTELLADAGREVIGVDLLGHGEAPKPHDPAAYADMTTRIVDALPDEPVDIVGFSLGAITTLRLATRRPELFNRIVLSRCRPQPVRARRGAAASGSSPASRAPATPTTTRAACSASTPRSRATTARRSPPCCAGPTRACSRPRT